MPGGGASGPAATVLPPWSSVLAVVAHPDDESFGIDAVLGVFHRVGARTAVLALTHGETTSPSRASPAGCPRRPGGVAAGTVDVANRLLLDSRTASWIGSAEAALPER